MYFRLLEVFIYSLIIVALITLLFALAYFLAPREEYYEKVSPYECGFEPFGDARKNFDIQFYIIAILFILFDIEILFLLPWSLTFSNLGMFGFFSMMWFLFLFIIGLIFEWKKGLISWIFF